MEDYAPKFLLSCLVKKCAVGVFCMEGPTIKGGKTTGVYWANGVVFIYYPLPTSTEIAAKALIEERKVYWAFVSYTLMPQYKSIIETKERLMVPVIDMSTSNLFRNVAKWLKEQT